MSTTADPVILPSHGTSEFTKPDAGFIAGAEFWDFAPAPCSCYGCFVPEAQKKRTFLRVYENRVEMNKPLAPCLCLCDDEKYMADQTWMAFFDKPPFRPGMTCVVCPLVCCGPPVIFAHNPKCCCIDLSYMFGSTIKMAPCNCWGLKEYLCFGNPCYVKYSIPLVGGLKNPDQFLAHMKGATMAYQDKLNIPSSERVVYASVSDNIGDFGGTKKVPAASVENVEMSRG